MVDTRCYNCILTENGPVDPVIREYTGDGKFKCTRCSDILDLSEKTYVVEIERIIDDGKLFTTFLKLDDRLKNFADPTEDIDDLFDDLDKGKYRCEVYIHWYPVCDDWDVDVALFESKKRLMDIDIHGTPIRWCLNCMNFVSTAEPLCPVCGGQTAFNRFTPEHVKKYRALYKKGDKKL